MNRSRQKIQLHEVDYTEHIRSLIFNELNERFGFPVKEWKKKFEQDMARRPRNVSAEDHFCVFGNTYINPVLNDILCRNRLYPTFNNLVTYVVNNR